MGKGIGFIVLFLLLMGCEKKVFTPPPVSNQNEDDLENIIKKNRTQISSTLESENEATPSRPEPVAVQRKAALRGDGDLGKIQTLIKEKQYKKALDQLNVYLEQHPDQIPPREMKLDIYIAMNDIVRVQQTLKEILKRDPKNSYILARSGDFFVKRKRYQEALNSYLSLLEIEETYPFLYNTAFIYEQLNQLSNALKYYQKGAELKPGAPIYYTMGDIARKLKKFQDATTYLNKTIRYDRKHLDAYKMLASVKMEQKQYADAIKYYKIVVQNRADLNSFRNLAIAYQYNNQYREALDYYKKALSLNRGNSELIYRIAYACYKTKDASQMMQYIQRYQRLGSMAKTRQLKVLHSKLLQQNR